MNLSKKSAKESRQFFKSGTAGASRNSGKILTASIASLLAITGSAMAQQTWVGDTSRDWNTASNWSGGAVPGGNAIINTTPANIALISADLAATPVDIIIGSGAGTNGRLDHTAGMAATGSQNWMFVGVSGGTGTYNLADTASVGGTFTGFGTGSGSLNVGGTHATNGRLYIGSRDNTDGGTGTVNINTTGTVRIANDLFVGSRGGTGVLNLDSGTVTTGAWNYIGRQNGGAAGATGTVRMSGGTFTQSGARTFVGLDNAVGTMEITGGVYNNLNASVSTQFAIGVRNIAAAAPSSVTMSGGTINANELFTIGGNDAFRGDANATFLGAGKGIFTMNGESALLNVTGELWVGNRATSTGVMDVSAGLVKVNNWVAVGRNGGQGTLTLSGTGRIEKTGAGNFEVGGGAGGVGILNLDGGTLNTHNITRNGAGSGTVNLNGGVLQANASNAAFMQNMTNAFVKAGGAQIDTENFNITIAQPLLADAVSLGGGLTKLGTGELVLTGTSTYTGQTAVNSGTLTIADTGGINNSSGIVLNGADARLLHRGSVNVTPQVTVTNGTLDGTGMLDLVVVGDGTGGKITNGNGTAVPLNIGTLEFNGDANITAVVNNPSVPGLSIGTLTTGVVDAGGIVTIGATSTTGIWTNGLTYTLINYAARGGEPSAFQKGVIPGLSSRQSATLGDTGFSITLAIDGDFPVWTGALDGRWTTASLAEPKNWILQTAGTSTDFIAGDAAIFNDDATGTTTLNISDAEVNITSAVFENTTKPYAITSSGGFGITGGSITKNGGGSLTVETANSHSGGTTLNAGTLNINNGAALGTGTLTIAGGTIDNTSGGAITLAANNAQRWLGNVTFTGTNALNLGTGPVTLGTDSADQFVIVANNSALAEDSLIIGGPVTAGIGGTPGVKTLSITGPGSTVFSGNLTAGTATGLVITTTATGKLTLSGAASAIRTLNMNGGASSIVELGAGNLTVANGGGSILQSTTGGTINATGGGSLVLGSANGDFGTAGGTTLTVNAPITGANSVDFWNANGGGMGTIVLNNANTYTGGTNVQNTKVVISATGAINATNAANIGQINVGDSANSAELEINGGTINATKTAGASFAVGIANGANGTVTITSGAINATNEMWLANGVGGQATMNVSGGQVTSGSWLAVGRDRGTGTLNLSGGTVTKGTGSGFIIIGSIGGTGTVTQTGGALNTANNGIRMGENSGNIPSIARWDMQGGTSAVTGEINVGWRSSEATWNVSGNSVVTATGRLIVGAETWTVGANGGAVVNGNPVGTVNISGGSVTFSGGDNRIGGDAATTNGNSAASAQGFVNVSGGTLNFGGNLQIGAHGQGTMTISGTGVVNSTAGFPVVGRYPTGNGVMNITGGTFNQTGSGTFLLIAEEGTGTLNLNSGIANARDLRVGLAATGNGTINLNGGTLSTGSILKPNGASTAAFKLNGGTLMTTAANADLFAGFAAGSVTVESGGAVINTNGFDSTVTQGLVAGTPGGGLTKQGDGVLTLAGANTYEGDTIVEAGTLAVTGSISGSSDVEVWSGAIFDVSAAPGGLSVASGTTLSGAGVINGSVSMAEGSILAPGQSPGTLSVTGNLNIEPAITPSNSGALQFELAGVAGSDKVVVTTGTLTIGSGQLSFEDFAFSTLSGFGPGVYTLFDTNTAINGTFGNQSGSLGGDFTGMLGFTEDNEDIILTVVPEPGSAVLLLGGLGSLLGMRRVRRRAV